MKPALLVIDVQKIYTTPGSDLYCRDTGKTIDHINKIISHFEARDWPIILVRHVHRADGSDLGRMFDFAGEPEPEFNFKSNTDEIDYDQRLRKPLRATEITKNRYSAFRNTSLDEALQRFAVDGVVICGFMTNFCCDSTARDAHDRDYFVDVIIDATGTPGTDDLTQTEIRKIVSQLLGAGYARILSTRRFLKP